MEATMLGQKLIQLIFCRIGDKLLKGKYKHKRIKIEISYLSQKNVNSKEQFHIFSICSKNLRFSSLARLELLSGKVCFCCFLQFNLQSYQLRPALMQIFLLIIGLCFCTKCRFCRLSLTYILDSTQGSMSLELQSWRKKKQQKII